MTYLLILVIKDSHPKCLSQINKCPAVFRKHVKNWYRTACFYFQSIIRKPALMKTELKHLMLNYVTSDHLWSNEEGEAFTSDMCPNYAYKWKLPILVVLKMFAHEWEGAVTLGNFSCNLSPNPSHMGNCLLSQPLKQTCLASSRYSNCLRGHWGLLETAKLLKFSLKTGKPP